jgi:three-Cys-motif partner protein
MDQTEEFFSDLKEWSARKLSIIEKYLGGFSKILGSRFRAVYYIDGFAGRGIYDNGEKGSPVLAAETAQKFQQSATSFTLHCINVEKDHDNYSNLCAETQRFGNLVQNYEGGFEENVDDILSQINSNPAVFFIDPFGVKGTSWNSVEKVIARRDSTDIWLRFDHKTVRRLSGFYDSDAKDAQGKLQTLQNLFGITDSNNLRARLGAGATPDERINNAVILYIEQLENAFKKFGKKGFAASYEIISINGKKKYHLVFACSHVKAATLASNIVNGIEETFQHEKEEYKQFQSGQMNLFSSDVTEKQVFEDKVTKLKSAILMLPKRQALSREELHYELMVQDKSWFGKIGRKHLTQALKELLNETHPKITCIGTPGNDDSTFTILE